MHQNAQQPKITKRVIIINQKNDIINENINIANQEPLKNTVNDQKDYLNNHQSSNNQPFDKKKIEDMLDLYRKNNIRIKELHNVIVNLKEKTASLEQFLDDGKRKRMRRKSTEIDKMFKCIYCEKTYGSDISLNLHMRMKHKQH